MLGHFVPLPNQHSHQTVGTKTHSIMFLEPEEFKTHTAVNETHSWARGRFGHSKKRRRKEDKVEWDGWRDRWAGKDGAWWQRLGANVRGEEMVESERRHEVGNSPHCRGLYTSAQKGSARRTHWQRQTRAGTQTEGGEAMADGGRGVSRSILL